MRLEVEAMAEHNGAPRRAPLRPFLRDAVGGVYVRQILRTVLSSFY